jgi:hydrogenase maturation factor HypE
MIVRRGPGLLGTMARTAVVAGTASAVTGALRRRQAEKAQEAARADLTGKLKELADLHSAGVLSDAEFAAAKAKLLA